MSNQIKLKRGSGSDPGTSDLVVGEVALRTDSGQLFTKKDDGNIAEIGAQAGVSDGDKGDITVSNSGATFTIDNNAVSTAKLADMPTGRILGREASGTGDPQYLTATEARSVLNVEDGATADQTASEILTLLKTVDGSGSGLVAERVTLTNQAGDSSCSVLFAQSATGDQLPHTNAKLTFDATSGTLKIGGASSIFAENNVRFKSAGDAFIDHNTTGQDIKFRVSNSSSLDTTPVTIQSDGQVNIGGMQFYSSNNVAIPVDGARFKLGANDDFGIRHDAGGPTIFDDANNQGVKFQFKELNITEYTGSTTRLKLDTNGNVGIGTSTINDDPEHCKLVISGQSGNAAGVLIFQDTSNNEDGMIFADNGNLYIVADRDNTASGSSIIFRVDGSSQKMRLDSSGNLTITGTVDGRDIASDGSKLDGIASGATNVSNTNQLTNGAGFLTSVGTSNISNNAVTFAKIEDIAQNRIIGRVASGSGDPTTLTAANVRTMINVEDGATADQSASEILTLLKTVDGSGSGLDADLLDGITSGSFLRSDADDTASGVITFTNSGQYPVIIGDTSGMHNGRLLLRGSSSPYITFREGNTDKGYVQWDPNGYMRIKNEETGEDLRIQSGTNGLKFGVDGTFYNVWHQGNDGSGSTLDADTVDGLDSTQFVRSDASDTMNGTYTISTSADQKLILAGSTNPYIRFQEGTTNKAYIQWDGSQLILVNQESSDYLRIGSGLNGLIYQADGVSGTVWHSGNDGAGSGLNADLLDGITSGSFLRSDANDTATGNITFTDNTQAKFGSDGDLEIFHDGSNSYISDQGTGSLILKSSTIDFTNAAQNEFLARFFQDSAVELYFNGGKKWETTADGVNLVDNKLTFQGTANRNIIFRSGNNDILYEFDAGDFYRQNIGNSTHEFFVGNTERLRVQNGSVYVNGSLGIGTTSPARLVHIQNSSDFGIRLTKTAASDAEIKNTNSLDLCCSSGGAGGQVVRILTGASPTSLNEQMRVAGTKVLIGMNSTQISSPNNPRMQVYQQMGIMAQDNANQRTALVFQNPAGRQGFINTNASGITIVGTSDYRVKENVNYSIDGITKIKQVKPCTFKFKADEENTIVHGFIAHELQSVLPEAVTGEKDEIVTQAKIDAGEYEQETLGNEVHQGVDAGKLIPLLTKALQEIIGKVEVLETEVAALKAG